MGMQGYAPTSHSGIGIASFILSLLCGLTLVGIIIVAMVIGARSGGELDERSPAVMAIGCSALLGLALTLLGLILGIVGIMQKDRKKTFAILGLIFNAVILVGTVALILVGMAMG